MGDVVKDHEGDAGFFFGSLNILEVVWEPTDAFHSAQDKIFVGVSNQNLVGDLQNEADQKQDSVLVLAWTGEVRNSVRTDYDGYRSLIEKRFEKQIICSEYGRNKQLTVRNSFGLFR